MKKNKKAQEEMVGFVLIIIIVAIIILVFIGFSINTEEEQIESYKVESFIQSFLQYTTECENNIEKLTIQKLVSSCNNNDKCLDERDSCEVLNSELKGILNESWKVGENSPNKGYELIIRTDQNKTLVNLRNGEKTGNLRGDSQDFSRSGTLIEVIFQVYS